ncbi:ABC transporter permease [Ruminococcus sp. OA3]|uniref:ABC transporter permease n=1 Tax=Ruminococcus sp. OA3 TaxID=2914164 RepID=UPI001F056A97|nr:ABC transporter permease [Ruminococcus sp. OA3]
MKDTSRIYGFMKNNMNLIIFIVIFLTFALNSRYSFSVKNIMNILTQNSYIITVTMGMAVLMISGSVDISVGSQISLIGIVCARMLTLDGMPVVLVVVTALLLGILLNLINISLSIFLKLPLIIVSIGTMTLYQGIVDLTGTSRAILIYNDAFRYIGRGYLGPVSVQFILACAVFVTAFLLLHKTYPGRYMYAVGSNNTAAELSGINVTVIKAMASVFYGISIGSATLIHISRMGSAQTGMGNGIEITAVTAALLGGISVKGGTGRVSQVFLSTLSLSWLSYMILMTSSGVHYRNIVSGFLLIMAFGYDLCRNRKRQPTLK